MDKRNNKRKYFHNINVSVFQIHTEELILISTDSITFTEV